ncbi:EF-hand [Rhizoclosmatium globosum]|uniref:EF-hand n=1 Tax=Rhizoclosmatium globosum TaxID=329046 RepID=A0A1Y2AV40_9FUNG|nr:EF-hand [Rhizoclosmatium globosum]|eukprot:ORY26412.1 EF-hand [Rhizoclosmatium globosum]
MTFLDFQAIKAQLDQKFHRFFKPSIFLKFVPDEMGCISVLQFFNYVLRKVSLMQARLDLSYYDADNDGFLVESELNQYVADLIPSLKLDSLNPSVHQYYICSSVRKFLFFMDPLKRGKIAIQKILLSPILTELFELREPELPEDYERTNWFSAFSALKIYGQYLSLDTDQNGMISRSEMSKFNNGTLTDLYLDRVYEERQTRRGNMDYKTFVDFVLAIENPNAPESITYQFKLLDVKAQGYLDDFTIGYLFKSVVEKMISFGHEPVHVADVVNEVFDMANPKVGDKITLEDLLKCGVGGTITTILTDCRGFWAYDNRESLEGR